MDFHAADTQDAQIIVREYPKGRFYLALRDPSLRSLAEGWPGGWSTSALGCGDFRSVDEAASRFEEARAKCSRCDLCGKLTGSLCQRFNCCDTCDFWLIKADQYRDHPSRVFSTGKYVYYLGWVGIKKLGRYESAASLGYGGSPFWIRFNDGSVVETNNLWFNGAIPPHFRDWFPATAELSSTPFAEI